MTKFFNISTDNTLGGNSPSDAIVSSQKAIQEYIDNTLSGKADTDLDNLTSTGINFVAHAPMPDYSAGITLSNISSYQQITDDGYIWWNGTGGGAWNDIGIVFSFNGSTDNTFINIPNYYGVSMMVPVSKGTYVKSYGATSQIIFIPCKKGA